MYLNTLKPADGSHPKRKRVGRGMGSGFGKTGGRGHKGQKSRSGGFHKVGFEGGQMPIQRRLPKVGFASRKGVRTAQLRLSELSKIDAEIVDLEALIKAGVVPARTLRAKVFASGEITKSVILKGISVSKGAREAIESAKGRIDE